MIRARRRAPDRPAATVARRLLLLASRLAVACDAAAPGPPEARIRVVPVGDSITAGHGVAYAESDACVRK